MRRLVEIDDNFPDMFFPRSERGNRLSLEWGEPDKRGVYVVVITEHFDDNLVAAERARIRAAVEALPIWASSMRRPPPFLDRGAVLALIDADPERVA